ncbi:DUF4256 domain-containing protein [Niabella insulamsoli]|uniref:DUF4256 domain-containing protein n=1 Tax=Niabella insulamsoli TaxID=3144874 RepID=UPI0031FBFDE2
MSKKIKEAALSEFDGLLQALQKRFEKNSYRHKGIAWHDIEARLKKNKKKLWSLNEMDLTEGEPDVIGYDNATDTFLYCDCSVESPKGRRSLCYDPQALESRKEHKPKDSAIGMAREMGIEILDEIQYRMLQELQPVDLKTSSWIATPAAIRKLGGALFCDRRYDHVFVYHNGAESYYAARGFRGLLRI